MPSSRGSWKREVLTSLIALLFFTVLLGVVYPAIITGIGQLALGHQANGSVVMKDGKPVGSELIGQSFSRPGYFWSRPSALATPYDASTSTGSNLGPTNPALAEAVAKRVEDLRAAGADAKVRVPVDLVTTSGSGLDPHITPAAAYYQVGRVAKARGMTDAEVRALVDGAVEGRTLGMLGEARVNVVRLNIALDERKAPGR